MVHYCHNIHASTFNVSFHYPFAGPIIVFHNFSFFTEMNFEANYSFGNGFQTEKKWNIWSFRIVFYPMHETISVYCM